VIGWRRAAVPTVIWRNTLLLALSQALVGVGMQMVPTLGALVVQFLLGSVALAGIGTSIVGLTRTLAAYPFGQIADRYGRKPGLLLGLALGLVGTCLIGLAVLARSFPLVLLGMLVFGLGVGAAQQLRVAAADMYPPARRAEGLGYVLTGALVGALGGPLLVSLAQTLAVPLGLTPLALAWLLVPLVILPGMGLVSLVRPDPREIAADLSRYYPDYQPVVASGPAPALRLRTVLADPPKRAAFVASFVAQGTMAMVMALTALVLDHHGHPLPALSLSVAIHVVGMFGFSLPIGRLADRWGRRSVLLLGAFLSAAGALLVPATGDYWPITLGTFLVGLGWSCVSIAATAIIADTTNAYERGRVQGLNDTLASVANVVLPLAVGPLVAWTGLLALGWMGLLLTVPSLVLAWRLREPRPGRYTPVVAPSC